MKALIYAYSINFARDLGIELITAGIESYKTSSLEEVFIILEKAKDITLLITENWEIDFLKKIKETRPDLIIYTLLSKAVDPAKFMKLKEIGINSCIVVSENITELFDELLNSIIKQNIQIKERRHFLRITPSKIDNFEAALFHKGYGNYIRGKVLNVSMGGFAFVPYQPELYRFMEISKTYDPTFLSFHGHSVKNVSSLVAEKNGVFGLRFDNIEPKDRRKLATYIYERLEEDIKELLRSAV
ncbi:MAG: PilZ domain-containing protein [Brevinematia bacterium]